MTSQSVDVPLWAPSPEQVADSNLEHWRRARGIDAATAAAIHQWSVDNPGEFWDAAFESAVTRGSRGSGPAIVAQQAPPGATFFEGAVASYAEELLAGGERPGAGDSAIVRRREDGLRETWSWQDLRAAVSAARRELMSAGVGPGDRVAAWMPNTPATLVAMAAASSLGAVFSSASPDFGPEGVADRFAQVEPTVLVAADGYHYGGKIHDRLSLLPKVLELLPTVSTALVVGEVAESPDLPHVPGVDVRHWRVRAPDGATTDTEWLRVPYAHPGFVLFSSGTTGKPKCIVHSGMGLLVKHFTEHVLHCDVRPGDVVFYYTTCGWMMWNWLVSGLAWGATIVMYDGSPFAPTKSSLWDIAAEEGVTLFGTSAKYLDACRVAGLKPRETHDLSRLRTVASTGSPLSDGDFRYVYDDVAPDVHLASISGGTDICGCFVLGNPLLPVFAGEIQGPALGVAVDVYGSAGQSLARHPGQRGDLVCTQPMPSMPLRFWGDPEGDRYRAAYFEQFPGVWTHGDFAEWTAHGGIVISGRSDATLNSGGVRIGTAEIYRQVEHFPQFADALAVGREVDNDTEIVLFVTMAPGEALDDELIAALRRRLRTHASPRHVPARIVAVTDVPRTRSGKIAELAVADVINGREVRNTHALANPECLQVFAQMEWS